MRHRSGWAGHSGRPVHVGFGSSTSFSRSQHVRFAPGADIRPMSAVYEHTPWNHRVASVALIRKFASEQAENSGELPNRDTGANHFGSAGSKPDVFRVFRPLANRLAAGQCRGVVIWPYSIDFHSFFPPCERCGPGISRAFRLPDRSRVFILRVNAVCLLARCCTVCPAESTGRMLMQQQRGPSGRHRGNLASGRQREAH